MHVESLNKVVKHKLLRKKTMEKNACTQKHRRISAENVLKQIRNEYRNTLKAHQSRLIYRKFDTRERCKSRLKVNIEGFLIFYYFNTY